MENDPSPPTFIHPQPRTLRWAATLVVAIAALAAGLALWGRPALAEWLNDPSSTADERARRVALGVATLVVCIGSLCLVFAALLGALAGRIRRAGVYPPPGYPVLARTLQVRGRAARAQALWHTLGAAFAVLLGAAALGGLFLYLPLAEVLRLLRP